MSAAVGAVSTTKDVSFNAHLEEEHKNKGTNKVGVNYDDAEEIVPDEDEEEEEEPKLELDLGPQFSLKEQLEKDKVRFFFEMVSEFILFVSSSVFLMNWKFCFVF